MLLLKAYRDGVENVMKSDGWFSTRPTSNIVMTWRNNKTTGTVPLCFIQKTERILIGGVQLELVYEVSMNGRRVVGRSYVLYYNDSAVRYLNHKNQSFKAIVRHLNEQCGSEDECPYVAADLNYEDAETKWFIKDGGIYLSNEKIALETLVRRMASGLDADIDLNNMVSADDARMKVLPVIVQTDLYMSNGLLINWLVENKFDWTMRYSRVCSTEEALVLVKTIF